jgi:hypothetical protein
MKKLIFSFLVVLFACSSLLYSQAGPVGSMSIQKYVGMMQQAQVTLNDLRGMRLPFISGTWYFVDGYAGNNNYDGLTPEAPLLTLAAAYAKCTTGRGDGIVILSRTISGTSYSPTQTSRLVWTKYGITVVGIASPNVYFGRARLTHTTGADSLTALIQLTGQNNTFINIDFYNSPENDGDPVSATAVVSAIQIIGVRNTLIGCHLNCTPQSANAYKCDVELGAGSDETRIVDCFFGSSSYDAGNNAACWVYMSAGAMAAQRFFQHCTFLQQVSAGTAFGAIKSGGATSMNGVDIYEDCTFSAWRASTSPHQMLASFFIGTNFGSGYIHMRDCSVAGWTVLDSAGGNDKIFTNQPAANSAGGITVTP